MVPNTVCFVCCLSTFSPHLLWLLALSWILHIDFVIYFELVSGFSRAKLLSDSACHRAVPMILVHHQIWQCHFLCSHSILLALVWRAQVFFLFSYFINRPKEVINTGNVSTQPNANSTPDTCYSAIVKYECDRPKNTGTTPSMMQSSMGLCFHWSTQHHPSQTKLFCSPVPPERRTIHEF